MRIMTAVLAGWLIYPSLALSEVTELRRAGYSLIPAPQQVSLKGGAVEINSAWNIEGGEFEKQWINRWSREFHQFEIHGGGSGRIVLNVIPGTVPKTVNEETADQAYRIDIATDLVSVTGNSPAGLFHGLQTFIQLLKRGPKGKVTLPVGTITDWPDLQLRFIHWDFLS